MAIMMKRQKRRGLALVEAALAFPLLMMLTVGLLEYGWMFIKVQQLNSAAREAVRVWARRGGVSGDATTKVTNIMSDFHITGYNTTTTSANGGTPTPGTKITVTVTVPYNSIHLIGAPLIPVPTNVKGELSMVKE